MENRSALLGTSAFVPPGVMFMAAPTIDDLQGQQEDLLQASQDIVALADKEERELTEEEIATIEDNESKVKNLKRQISARQAAAPVAVGQGTRSTREPVARNEPNDGNRRTVPATPREPNRRGGHNTFGDFAIAVRQHALSNFDHEGVRKLTNVATSTEGVGADGGFAVPPEFRQTIWQKVMDQENLMSRTEQLVTGSNSLTFPKDETTPWQTSGGLQCTWEGEASTIDQSKVALTMDSVRLSKLAALVPVSEELLEDAPGIESYLRAKVPAKMVAKINTAIISGTGAGQPRGILSSGSLISVAAEQSQAADTILFANINSMWNRLWAPLRRNAVWLINQDIEPQLDVMEFSPGSTVPIPVYLPAGGVSERPYATLKGRPVLPVEACSTLGDKGDIILTDLSQYMTLTKGQDIRTDVSIHLFFDTAKVAFRFILRMNGQPMWGSTIAPQNGNVTRSWAVTLDARA